MPDPTDRPPLLQLAEPEFNALADWVHVYVGEYHDNQRLLAEILDTLRRIDDRAYGYCEESGEPIGLARLEARPIATLGLEAQERHERRERVHRDD